MPPASRRAPARRRREPRNRPDRATPCPLAYTDVSERAIRRTSSTSTPFNLTRPKRRSPVSISIPSCVDRTADQRTSRTARLTPWHLTTATWPSSPATIAARSSSETSAPSARKPASASSAACAAAPASSTLPSRPSLSSRASQQYAEENWKTHPRRDESRRVGAQAIESRMGKRQLAGAGQHVPRESQDGKADDVDGDLQIVRLGAVRPEW